MPAMEVVESKVVAQYRVLPPEEWHRLRPIFDALDAFLPPEFLATAAVAENEEGKIVGFLMLQMVMHAEPCWIAEDYSGRVNYLRLWKFLDELPKNGKTPMVMPGYVLVARDEKIARMAELGGFEKVEGSVWIKKWER